MIILQQIESLQKELDELKNFENRDKIAEADRKMKNKDILSKYEKSLSSAIEDKKWEMNELYGKPLMQLLHQNALKLNWSEIAENLSFADLNGDFQFNVGDVDEMTKIVNLWAEIPVDRTFKSQNDITDFLGSLSDKRKDELTQVLRRSRGEEFLILLSEKEKIKSFRKEHSSNYQEFNPLEYPWLELMTAINRISKK